MTHENIGVKRHLTAEELGQKILGLKQNVGVFKELLFIKGL